MESAEPPRPTARAGGLREIARVGSSPFDEAASVPQSVRRAEPRDGGERGLSRTRRDLLHRGLLRRDLLRRDLLRLAMGAAASLVVLPSFLATPLLRASHGSAERAPADRLRRPAADAARRLAGILTDARSAAVVGRAYLQAYPEERSLPVLVETLCEEHPLALRSGTGPALRRSVTDAVRRDFERRDVVRVQGWVLSRTEARVAAVSALAC